MNKISFALILILCILSCDNSKMDRIKRAGQPDIYSTGDSDKKMNDAIETARRTLDQFDRALKNNDYDSGTTALKVKFPTSTGFEHIWIAKITLDSGTYQGILDNVPDKIKNIKMGDKITIHREDITDWMFGKNGKLVGGFTIRLIRDRMTEQEKKDFDKDLSLKIDK